MEVILPPRMWMTSSRPGSRPAESMNVNTNKRVLEFGKRCPRCGETKPVTEFHTSSHLRADGYASCCKACGLAYHRERAKEPKRYAKRKAYNFDASLKSRYGITAAEAREMLRRQMGLCGNRGCGSHLSFDVDRRAPNRAQVDHCHTTGKVRGILCRRCNTGAAIIEKDENVYLGLLEYVSLHKS